MPQLEEARLFSLPDHLDKDFSDHNAESAALWKAYEARSNERIPVRFNCNPRILMLDPKYNLRGLAYEEYMTDPAVMSQAVLEWQYFTRFILPGDQEKGLPDEWMMGIDFENSYDAAWFGCPVHYRDGQVPDTTPILNDDNKRMLFDRGVPEPFAGEWAERALAILDFQDKKRGQGWDFLGVPVGKSSIVPFVGCDGVFTIAANLRGATELFLDLLSDPDYIQELLEYILVSVTERMTAWKEKLGLPVKTDGFGSADDSIEALSVEQYIEHILPFHRRLYDTFGTKKNRAIHLCGNAQRHFKLLHDELGIMSFDTGFPVDFGAFRRDLGPDVQVSGGPSVPFFLQDDAALMEGEVERILRSGILEGGRFILQEGNNLPPRARLEMCEAVHRTGKRLGIVPRQRPEPRRTARDKEENDSQVSR